MSLPSKDKIYGNCKVLHPDGTLMFRCDDDRVNWYLERNLAEIISPDGEPITIQFTFQPKGKGHQGDPFYLQEKSNCCVVCGTKKLLTRHHAVPICYRKHFPDRLKSRCSHDILPVCVDCHETYEIEAQKLKREIAAKYKIAPHNSVVDRDFQYAKSAANALMKHSDKIPLERQVFLKERISKHLGHEALEEDIASLAAFRVRSSVPSGNTIRLLCNWAFNLICLIKSMIFSVILILGIVYKNT